MLTAAVCIADAHAYSCAEIACLFFLYTYFSKPTTPGSNITRTTYLQFIRRHRKCISSAKPSWLSLVVMMLVWNYLP